MNEHAWMYIEQGDNDFQTRIYLIFDLQGYHSGYMLVIQDTLRSKSKFTARILAMVAALSLSFGGRKHKEGLLDWNALPSLKLAVRTWKLVVGRWIPFWDGLFSGHEGLQNSWKATTIKGPSRKAGMPWIFFFLRLPDWFKQNTLSTKTVKVNTWVSDLLVSGPQSRPRIHSTHFISSTHRISVCKKIQQNWGMNP